MPTILSLNGSEPSPSRRDTACITDCTSGFSAAGARGRKRREEWTQQKAREARWSWREDVCCCEKEEEARAVKRKERMAKEGEAV